MYSVGCLIPRSALPCIAMIAIRTMEMASPVV